MLSRIAESSANAIVSSPASRSARPARVRRGGMVDAILIRAPSGEPRSG